jgi:hypothetical protein
MIFSDGLLMTPERLRVRPYALSELAQLNEAPEATIQTRSCFTLSSVEGLTTPLPGLPDGAQTSHADLFGAFGVGLDLRDARDLQINPCMYFYWPASATEETIGAHFLYALVECKELLVMLARLHSLANPEEDGSVNGVDEGIPIPRLLEAGIQFTHQPMHRLRRSLAVLDGLSANELGRIVNLLDLDRRPIWNLVEMINILISTMQTADSQRGRLLAYFQQREWRVIRLITSELAGYPLATSADMAKRELPIVGRLRASYLRKYEKFCSEFRLPIPPEHELRDYYLLAGVNKSADGRDTQDGVRLMRDYVRIVVAPKEAKETVNDIVQSYSFLAKPPKVMLV